MAEQIATATAEVERGGTADSASESSATRVWRLDDLSEGDPHDKSARLDLATLRDTARSQSTNTPVILSLQPHEDVDLSAEHLDQIALIELQFGTFTEGRPFSQARRLRDQLGYVGELRAVGDITIDRLGFMLRAGFDSAVLPARVGRELLQSALGSISSHYQPAPGGGGIIAVGRGHRVADGGGRKWRGAERVG